MSRLASRPGWIIGDIPDDQAGRASNLVIIRNRPGPRYTFQPEGRNVLYALYIVWINISEISYRNECEKSKCFVKWCYEILFSAHSTRFGGLKNIPAGALFTFSIRL